MNNWNKFFPEKYKPRQLQTKAIEFVIDTFFTKRKRYCILESPVGTGKSFIASTIANYINSLDPSNKSYILTTQIILQNQYQRQFPEFANISSKANYICNMFKDSTCGDMKWLHQYSGIPRCKNCPYETEKKHFLSGDISITNTAFFMTNLQYNEDLIKNRQFLAIDEAHNLQEQIIKYKSINIEYSILAKEYAFPKKLWIREGEDVFTWIIQKLYPWLDQKAETLKSFIQNRNTGINLAKSKVIDISRKYDFLDKLTCQLNRSIDIFDPDRWIVQNDIDKKIIKITPLFAYDFSQNMMFRKANKILLMSGTILNKYDYCKNLGIPIDDCEFLSLDSPFPVENRKIFVLNSGSMSRKNMQNTLPFLIEDIRKVLELHKHQKGIIHVSSHNIAKLIYQGVDDPRLIIANQFANRDEMLQYHYNSEDNTVLISPSMMQGLDLKDDLSRFQIIAKVPFPNLGDKYIATKKDLVKHWYQYQTAKTMVQAYGRSIRSQQDYAVTYIMDQDFNFLYKNNKQLFPKYFCQAISYGKL